MSFNKKLILFIILALFQFFLARLSLLLLYPDQFSSLGSFQTFFGFIEGLRFDLSSLAVFCGFPLILMSLPFKIFHHRYWQTFCWIILYVVLTTMTGFLMADVVYFDFVKRHITHELFLMGKDDIGVMGETAFNSFLPHLGIFILNAVIIFILWKKVISHSPSLFGKGLLLWLRFTLILALLTIAGRGGLGDKPVTIIDAFASGRTAYGNLILNGVFSVSHSSLKAKNIKRRFFEHEEAVKIFFSQKESDNKNYPFQKENSGPARDKYNLVLVLTESLSFKYIDALAHRDYGVTPNLDILAKEGVVLNNFYAAGQRSVEGLQAVLTGVPSIIGAPTIGVGILANYSKLGEFARKNGYSPVFIQSLKRRSFRGDAIAGAAGFRAFYGMEDMPVLLDYPDPKAAKYGWDYETYMRAAEIMEAVEKPFLFIIVTSSTHTPYPRLPTKLEKYPHNKNKEEGFLNTLYYSDWSIGEFLKKVGKKPWFDKTIFMFTADHALAHYQGGSFLERFHIPLIIYAPKILNPQVIDLTASQLDIFDTIVDLLGLRGKYSSFGRSIFSRERFRADSDSEFKNDSFAIVREGSIMGIITKRGFLRHSLKNRLETGSMGEKPDKKYFQWLEKKLLSADQLSHELLRTNRWAERQPVAEKTENE